MIAERIEEILAHRQENMLPPAKQLVIGGFHAKNLAEYMLSLLEQRGQPSGRDVLYTRTVLSGSTFMGLPIVYIGDRDFIGIGE